MNHSFQITSQILRKKTNTIIHIVIIEAANKTHLMPKTVFKFFISQMQRKKRRLLHQAMDSHKSMSNTKYHIASLHTKAMGYNQRKKYSHMLYFSTDYTNPFEKSHRAHNCSVHDAIYHKKNLMPQIPDKYQRYCLSASRNIIS